MLLFMWRKCLCCRLFPYKRTCLLTIQAGLSVTPSISVPKSGRQLHVFPPGAVVDIVRCSFLQRHVRKIYITFPCYFCRLFYNHHKLTWYRLWRLRKGHLNHPKKRFFNSVLVTEFDLYKRILHSRSTPFCLPSRFDFVFKSWVVSLPWKFKYQTTNSTN